MSNILKQTICEVTVDVGMAQAVKMIHEIQRWLSSIMYLLVGILSMDEEQRILNDLPLVDIP